METTELISLLAASGGVARRSGLTHVPAVTLRAAVATGRVIHLPGGVYHLPRADPALVAAVVHRARLTCVTAAAHLGLTVLDVPDTPHLAVPRSRGSSPSDARAPFPARLHRAGPQVRPRAGVPVVPLAHALARMLLCQTPVQAIVAIDSGLAQGRVTPAQIRASLPRTAPARTVALLLQADGRSRSPIETVARLALVAAGFTVEPGCHLPGVGEVDLLVEGCVVVELDGFAYHSGRREYREDRRRDREIVAQGMTVLRFTFEDVIGDPDMVVRAVRRALLARGRVARS